MISFKICQIKKIFEVWVINIELFPCFILSWDFFEFPCVLREVKILVGEMEKRLSQDLKKGKVQGRD